MSSYEIQRAHAQQLLARKNEQLRKERLAREKAKRKAKHVPLGWDGYYQIWLVVALLLMFGVNSPWGYELLFSDVVAVRVANLFLGAVVVAVAVFDILQREVEVTYQQEEAPPCTTESECSDASSGTSSPSSSGGSPPSSAWRGSWEAGTKRDSLPEASPAVSD